MADRGGMDVNEESLPRATVVKVIKGMWSAANIAIAPRKALTYAGRAPMQTS
jgi:hypothetical protein